MKNIESFFQNKLKLFYAFGLLQFVAFQSFSQNNSTDVEALIESVSKQLQNSVTDSTEVYEDMFKSVRLSKQAKDKTYLITSYYNLATWHKKNVTLDSTIYYLEQAEKVSKDAKLPILEAETYLKKESFYNLNGNNEAAMSEVIKALKLFEKIENRLGIAKSYTRLCDLLYYQEQYKEGSDYCEKAIAILKTLDVPETLGKGYRFQASNLLMLDQNDKALAVITKSIAAFKEAGSNEIDLAKNYNTRGNIYKYMKRYEDAVKDYKNCHEIAKKYNATGGIIAALANIGHVKILQEKHEEALPYTLEVIELMKKTGNTVNLRENYMHAARSYEALKEFENALKFEKLYSNARFGELQQINSQLESELQIKYESEKKDETIEAQDATISRQKQIQLLYIGIAILLGLFLLGMYFTLKNIRKKRETLAKLNTELADNQKTIEHSNKKLKNSLEELKATQAQLIQSEKMASLGELTAGIAHEIQNPLNFVNNFSEVSTEMIDDLNEEIKNGDFEEVKAISSDLKKNLDKILHHGKRADGIVKGMLQHSRINKGAKEPTDINKLTDEYFRLAYHGLRAKDKSFNANLNTDYDEAISSITIVPQDIGRVILNLITNAFYAVDEKRASLKSKDYKPTVSVSTKKLKNKIAITVKDNGNGIPKEIIDKIFQPFFTTKPTGKGTGLGLSMSYDIIKAHNGELKVETEISKYTQFIIILPIKNTKTYENISSR